MVLKYPTLILYYFRLLSCSPAHLPLSFTPSIMLEGVFPNGNQLLLRSSARMNRAATLPAVIHLLFAPSLVLLSPLSLQANLPARRSPPSLSAPLSFVNLFDSIKGFCLRWTITSRLCSTAAAAAVDFSSYRQPSLPDVRQKPSE